MSAQDDVMAAFGEPPRRTHAEAVKEIEAAVELEATAELEVAEANAAEASTAESSAEAGAAEAVGGDVSAPEDDGAGASVQASELSDASAPGEPAAGGQAGPGVGERPPALPNAAPAQPYLDPAAFFAQLQAEATPKPKRRWPRLALRYTSALVIAGAIGVGTAYAITLPRRTDMPFLATPSDDRYAFPFLVKPEPPAGEPAPGADGDVVQIHHGDLRQYLLPAPTGGKLKEDGWEPVADFESALGGADATNHLHDAGLRRVARRGWSTPDGQHTVIELVQLPDYRAASDVYNMLDAATPAKAGKAESVVPQVTVRSFGDATFTVPVHKFDQVDGLPGQRERRVTFQSGDVVVIVTTTAPAGVPDTPAEQIVMLQAEMLR